MRSRNAMADVKRCCGNALTRMTDRYKTPIDAWVSGVQKRHDSTLRQFIRRRTRNKQDVPDIAQEVYLRLLSVRDPDSIREPLALVYRIAHNILTDEGRRTRRRRVEFDSEAATRQLEGQSSLQSRHSGLDV